MLLIVCLDFLLVAKGVFYVIYRLVLLFMIGNPL